MSNAEIKEIEAEEIIKFGEIRVRIVRFNDSLRGWAFAIGGLTEIRAPEQEGYGSREDALSAAAAVIRSQADFVLMQCRESTEAINLALSELSSHQGKGNEA